MRRALLLAAAWTAVVAAVVLFVAGIVLVSKQVDKRHCRDTAHLMERDWTYGFFSGCLVEDDFGRYVPLDNWRMEEDGDG